MNALMSKDQFHEVIMLYLITLSQETKAELSDPDGAVFTQEFDDFLRHIQKRPLGKLRTAYMREDSKTKLFYKRMKSGMEDADDVRLML